MNDQLITLETARLAKEKGFDWKCYAYYSENNDFVEAGSISGANFNVSMEIAVKSAPSQSLLVRWLRDEHGWHIIIIPVVTTGYTFKITKVWKKNFDPNSEDIELAIETPPYKGVNAYDYESYEEALEQGLQEALKLI
jgi:hypothetical protein